MIHFYHNCNQSYTQFRLKLSEIIQQSSFTSMQGNTSEQNGQFTLENVQPVQYIFENVSVDAAVEVEQPDADGKMVKVDKIKTILKPCSGKFEPKTFTAIVGPSGCGKTTMLNLLSGRLISNNLSLYGNITINGASVQNVNKYKNLIGYVMQDDLIMATFTPRQTFKFVADLRLPHKSQDQRKKVVDDLIGVLGLRKCADTYVGNNMIRGISGGQRKRTSIGMQLLVNPSLIFLDQPTTGLDSTTALNLIRFLNQLAQSGRTIICTIHQPSSEIFQEFDKLMLMVDGHIIYNGLSADSIRYFANINMGVPVHSNPIDHYMKLMNKEGISLKYIEKEQEYTQEQVQKQFDEKIELLVKTYKEHEKEPKVSINDDTINDVQEASWCSQMCKVMSRAIQNELRNPIGVRAKIGQMIFFALITIILYERIAEENNSYLQNLRGTMFFLVMNMGFASVFGSLNVFNIERPVFIRERLSNTYSTSSYFFGRSLSYMPEEIILPFILVVVAYFAVHLNETVASFFMTYLSVFLVSWMGSAYGLFLSTLFSDAQVAMSLVPVLMIPFLLVGGFFAPLSNVPDFYKLFEYLSMFKYGFQAVAYSQFFQGLSVSGTTQSGDSVSYSFTYPDDYDSIFKFEDPFWLNFMMMAIIGLVLRILALIVMYFISNPKSVQLQPPPAEGTKNIQK